MCKQNSCFPKCGLTAIYSSRASRGSYILLFLRTCRKLFFTEHFRVRGNAFCITCRLLHLLGVKRAIALSYNYSLHFSVRDREREQSFETSFSPLLVAISIGSVLTNSTLHNTLLVLFVKSMPELPEVESLKRSLEKYIINSIISNIRVKKGKLVSGNGTKRSEDTAAVNTFINQLTGETITKLHRRAKNLIIEMKSGKVILIHLKMTGQLVFQNRDKEKVWGGHPIQDTDTLQLPHAHTHIIFTLNTGTLYYNDTRMFGYVLYFPSWEAMLKAGHLQNLGFEPAAADFTATHLAAKLKKRNTSIKVALMDQKIVAGLGNIYADECCFAAGIRPTRKASKVSMVEAEKLHTAIRRILAHAIRLGGSSVADYLLADGSRGNYAREHKVYGRAEMPCLQCGTKLRSLVLGGRTTVFCPTCQK